MRRPPPALVGRESTSVGFLGNLGKNGKSGKILCRIPPTRKEKRFAWKGRKTYVHVENYRGEKEEERK